MIRALLVDDERPARDRLRQMLATFPDIEVVGEASDGVEAVERIAALRPDLIFLDIQMPGHTGLEVASSLRPPRPRIVFCTAFDQYAIQAFEHHAIDCLLKPVTRARLSDAVQRVALPLRERDRWAREIEDAGLVQAGMFPNGLIPFEGIDYAGSRPQAIGIGGDYYDFIRLSRSSTVNLNEVLEVVPLTGGHGEVILKSGTRLEVSRRRMKDLVDTLEGPK